MNSAMSALLRRRFDAAMKARTVANLGSAIYEMEQTVSALHHFIAEEEARTRVTDVTHCTYSAPAKAARDRVLTLNRSIVDLTAKFEAAILDRDRALEALSALDAAGHGFPFKRERL